MPLILISGYPSSGKTYRSKQLADDFKSRIEASSDPRISRLTITHIDDQSLGIARDVYNEARTEKDARASFYSAVKRALGRDNIVIADGMNYIKGFRYQLYCEAKAVQTPSCVIHVGISRDQCVKINKKLLENEDEEGGYPEELLGDLRRRYEEPNALTRWDSPLFTVPFEDEVPLCDLIWEAIIGSEGKAKVVKPNQATVMKPPAESDYLYELDYLTQQILQGILKWQIDHPGEVGGEISLDGGNTLEMPASAVSLPQLQRIRRQFISLNRLHQLAKDRIGSSFAEYLNDNLG